MRVLFLLAVCMYFISARRSLIKHKGRLHSTPSKPKYHASTNAFSTLTVGHDKDTVTDYEIEIDNSEGSPSNPDDEIEIDTVPPSNVDISKSTFVARGVTAIRRMKWMTTTMRKADEEGDEDNQKFFDEDDDQEEEPPSRTTPIIGISLCLLLVSLSVGWMCCSTAESEKEPAKNPAPPAKPPQVVVQKPQPAKSDTSVTFSSSVENLAKEVKEKSKMDMGNGKTTDPLETHSWAPGDFGIS